jgi:uncharacterized membrane protein (DUF4010 family)
MSPQSPLELAGRLALAVGLAVFMGLTFEEVYKRAERANPGGVRTFPMLAMAGAALYLIEQTYALAFTVGLFGLAAWLYGFIRVAPEDGETPSFMIPASNLLAYALGPIALAEPPWVAVALAVTAVLLLGAREQLHRFSKVIPPNELSTAAKFLILTGIILPLAPHERVIALTPLTPYGIWLAVVAICTLSYGSYLLQRYAPIHANALLSALLGGAYSSTATTVLFAKRMRETKSAPADMSAGIVAATSVMYLRIGVIVAIFNREVALMLGPALVALAAIGGLLTAIEWRRNRAHTANADLSVGARNPLQIPTALIFAGLILVISAITVWMRQAFGEAGIFALAAVVGLTDIDPFVLNIAQGGVAGAPLAHLCAAILIAASSNNIFKAGSAIGFAHVHARRPAIVLIALAVLGVAVAVFYIEYVSRFAG